MIPTVPYHNERQLPSFSLRQIDLPEIVKWEVNGQYFLLVKVEMTGVHNRSDLPSLEDKSKKEADFTVLSVRAVDKYPIDTASIEKKEFEDLVTKVKSGEK